MFFPARFFTALRNIPMRFRAALWPNRYGPVKPRPVSPSAIPRIAANQNRMFPPAKASARAPTPWCEESADRDRRTEAKAYKKPWPRPDKENLRAVIGYEIIGSNRLNLIKTRPLNNHPFVP